MTITLPQVYDISPGDIELIAIDYTNALASAETLTNPSVVQAEAEEDSSESSSLVSLAFANIKINITEIPILGRLVAVGKAVQFKVSGQSLNVSYRIRITVKTTSSPIRTLIRDITFNCV